jgi:hypothetical protein
MTAELFISGPCCAGWGAGDNHHAGLEREIRREEVNEVGTRPDHVSSIARLA